MKGKPRWGSIWYCRVRRIRGQRELPRDDLRYVCCGGVAGEKKPWFFLLRERLGNVGQQITVLCRAVQHFRKWPLRNTVLERRHRHKPYTFDNYFWRIVKNSILLTTSFYAFQHLPYMIISLPTKFQPLFAIINVLFWETKRFSWDRHPMSYPMSHPMSYPTYVVTSAPPCGNLTGPLRDTYGTAGDRFGKLSRVDETMNLLHKTDMILVKLYRALARWTYKPWSYTAPWQDEHKNREAIPRLSKMNIKTVKLYRALARWT